METLRSKRFILLVTTVVALSTAFMLLIVGGAMSFGSDRNELVYNALFGATILLGAISVIGAILATIGFISETRKSKSIKPVLHLLAGFAVLMMIVGAPIILIKLSEFASSSREVTLSNADALALIRDCKVNIVTISPSNHAVREVSLFLKDPVGTNVEDQYRNASIEAQHSILTQVERSRSTCGNIKVVNPVR